MRARRREAGGGHWRDTAGQLIDCGWTRNGNRRDEPGGECPSSI